MKMNLKQIKTLLLVITVCSLLGCDERKEEVTVSKTQQPTQAVPTSYSEKGLLEVPNELIHKLPSSAWRQAYIIEKYGDGSFYAYILIRGIKVPIPVEFNTEKKAEQAIKKNINELRQLVVDENK